MSITRGLTPESLAVALGKYLLPSGSDTVTEAHRFWDLARYGQLPETHADEVARVRREWKADNPRGARAITWSWRGFWALSIVVFLVALGFAITSGQAGNLVPVVIGVPAIVGILAAVLDAVFSAIRNEPSSGSGEQPYIYTGN